MYELNSRQIIHNGFLKLETNNVNLPNGKTINFEVINKPAAVAAVVHLKNIDSILMVSQYRCPVQAYSNELELLELPAGIVDNNPIDCVKREVLEETGYDIDNLVELGYYYSSPGFTNEKLYLFYSDIAKKVCDNNGLEQENEYIKSFIVKTSIIDNLLYYKKIKDMKTVLGLELSRKYWCN